MVFFIARKGGCVASRIVNRCPKCDTVLASHGTLGGIGPKFMKCRFCGMYCKLPGVTDLAMLNDSDLRKECLTFMIFSSNMLCFVATLCLLFGTMYFTSEEWMNQGIRTPILFAIFFALCFAVKCFIKKRIFWRKLYPEAMRRLEDPAYALLIKKAMIEQQEEQIRKK